MTQNCSVAITAASEQCAYCLSQYTLYVQAQERKAACKTIPVVKITNVSHDRLKITALKQHARYGTAKSLHNREIEQNEKGVHL